MTLKPFRARGHLSQIVSSALAIVNYPFGYSAYWLFRYSAYWLFRYCDFFALTTSPEKRFNMRPAGVESEGDGAVEEEEGVVDTNTAGHGWRRARR